MKLRQYHHYRTYRWSRLYPFHAVCRCELAKHSAVVQDGRVGRIIELWVVSSCAEVQLALRLSEGIQFSCRCRLAGACGRSGGGRLQNDNLSITALGIPSDTYSGLTLRVVGIEVDADGPSNTCRGTRPANTTAYKQKLTERIYNGRINAHCAHRLD